ncbi:hypothetical protein [Staphylococcus aureus]|uniref:hypothetical protein n=1 Tax=Staphylococcus aureus TaxID=1280 RepID=UPI0015F2A164|nr:hypothetical protein [Staphylococcus aureus]
MVPSSDPLVTAASVLEFCRYPSHWRPLEDYKDDDDKDYKDDDDKDYKDDDDK